METMDNKTDRYFRDRLGNFEQSPPDASWESIARKMESRKKKRAMLIFFRIAAGMALLISTGIGLYLLSNKENLPSDTFTQAPGKQSTGQSLSNAPSDGAKELTSPDESHEIGMNDELQGSDINQNVSRNMATPYRSGEVMAEALVPSEKTDDESPVTAENSTEPAKELQTNENVKVLVIESDVAADVNISQGTSKDSSLTPEQAAAILLAQNNIVPEEPEEKPRRWIIGSEIAPLYSNRSLYSQAVYADDVNSMNSSETGILAYAGGIRVGVSAGKRITVQSGIYYSRYGQNINEVQTITGTKENSDNYRFIAAANSTGNIEGVISARTEAGFVDNLSQGGVFYDADIRNGITNSELKPLVDADAQSVQLKQYFDYFELPLIVKYKVIDRKFDFSFSGGLITNFMVGNTVNLITDGDSKPIGETSDINVINYLGSLGMGLEMPFAGNFSISLEPRFRYYINSIDRSGIISVHPYSFGFFAGVNYRF